MGHEIHTLKPPARTLAWEPAKVAARRMWRLWFPESLKRLSMQLRWKLSLGKVLEFKLVLDLDSDTLSKSGTLGNLLWERIVTHCSYIIGSWP